MNKNQIIKNVVEIILKHAKPGRIYLYGSQVSGDYTDVSDIDIAYDDKAADHMQIKDDVAAINTLIKIDVTNLEFTEDRFRNRVISTGQVLFSASKRLRAEDSFHNFSMALDRFVSVIDRKIDFTEQGMGDFFADTAVKRFEFTYEMSWKCLKRYLDYVGIQALSPRQVFKEAYANRLITDEAVWLDMIESRNLSSHIYNEREIMQIINKLADFKKAFIQLKETIITNLG